MSDRVRIGRRERVAALAHAAREARHLPRITSSHAAIRAAFERRQAAGRDLHDFCTRHGFDAHAAEREAIDLSHATYR